MKLRYLFVLGAMLSFAACSGGTPEDACQNMQDQCGEISEGSSVQECADGLQELLDKGTISQGDVDCLADASDCDGITNCSAATAGKALQGALEEAASALTDSSN